MKKHKTIWRLIAKSLGEKSGKSNREADQIAIIRLLMFLSILVTNGFIIANAIRHWNNNQCDSQIHLKKWHRLTGFDEFYAPD